MGRGGKTKETPWLIVGLGNPGTKYEYTRHNVGRDTVQILASQAQARFRRSRGGLEVAAAHLDLGVGGVPVGAAHLALPTTFMNLSGTQIASYMNRNKIPIGRLLVIHDDLDLPAHSLRLKAGGGEGGHNGLKSTSGALGSRDYARLRIGIGRPPGRMDPAKYVLAPIPRGEREEWLVTLEQAADVARDVVMRGLLAAQQDLHAAR